MLGYLICKITEGYLPVFNISALWSCVSDQLRTINSYSLCIQALQEELESIQREGAKKDEALNRLEQQLRDAEEEKQLAGKKGAAVMKDLQRQLAAERKRAEKLQDRIRDLLNEGTRVNTGSSLRIQFTTEMGEIFSKS